MATPDRLLYKLKLHQRIYYEKCNMDVVRVPGGWLYIPNAATSSPMFVPFDDEFKENSNEL